MQTISYSSDKLPAIRVNQRNAIKKFNSLYSSAVIKSITLGLDNNIYVYNIVGYDDRKDCMIQIDATNNKLLVNLLKCSIMIMEKRLRLI